MIITVGNIFLYDLLLAAVTSVSLIVIGQGYYGRVIIVSPRSKKVPEGVDMLAFYIQLLYGRTVFLNSHTLQVTVSNLGLGSTFAILAAIDLMATL